MLHSGSRAPFHQNFMLGHNCIMGIMECKEQPFSYDYDRSIVLSDCRKPATPTGIAIFNYHPNHPQKQPPTVPTIGPLWNDISSKIGSKFCILGSSSLADTDCKGCFLSPTAIGRRRSHVFRCDMLDENVNPGSEEATEEENSKVGADDEEETEDVAALNTNREV
ncbi:hypothetical protein Peur_006062 [Populus x canadensis]